MKTSLPSPTLHAFLRSVPSLPGLGIGVFVFLAAAVVMAQTAATPDVKSSIRSFGSLDYPVRMNAARLVRRAAVAEAVPALVDAVRSSTDEYVRYRALVVLTGFNDRGTDDLMRSLMRDRNDRVRAVAYQWLERHPDPRLTNAFLTALQAEQAEFVRPAVVSALAALGSDPQVQRALLAEITRGLDLFRSAVIDALGRHRATYAVDAIGAIAKIEGPLQDDAVLALGRIGDPRAKTIVAGLTGVPPAVTLTIRAAQCLLGLDCDGHTKALTDAASAAGAIVAIRRAAIEALSAVAAGGHNAAMASLLTLSSRTGPIHDEAGIGLATVAVLRPEQVITWLDAASDSARIAAVDLLKDGFDSLEEDLGEEQFFAVTRAAYWKAPEGSGTRALTSTLIAKLEF